MKKITLISHFYGNENSVASQIKNWDSFHNEIKDKISFILIDDCSPAKFDFNQSCYDLDLKVYKIIDDIRWNQAGARNLAALLTETEWAIYFDIDQIIKSNPLMNLISSIKELDKSLMYHLKSDGVIDTNNNNKILDFAPSTYLVNMSSFRKNGMLDEDFSGNYGYEDIYLHETWEKSNCQRVLINNESYFQDNNKHTTKLSRNLDTNKIIFDEKIRSGSPKPKDFIRFAWEIA